MQAIARDHYFAVNCFDNKVAVSKEISVKAGLIAKTSSVCLVCSGDVRSFFLFTLANTGRYLDIGVQQFYSTYAYSIKQN